VAGVDEIQKLAEKYAPAARGKPNNGLDLRKSFQDDAGVKRSNPRCGALI
jgi:hypothetical protein